MLLDIPINKYINTLCICLICIKNTIFKLVRQNKSFNSFILKGVIWKISVHNTKPLLILETRDAERRKTTFFAIDIEKQEIKWEKHQLQNSWWLGLEIIVGDKVFLHSYEDIQSPLHKGIMALDIITGKELWSNQELVYAGLNRQNLVMKFSGDEHSKFLEVDPQNGAILITIDQPIFTVQEHNHLVINPTHLVEGSTHFSRILDFIQQSTGKMGVLAIDYLEYNEHIILAFYIKEDDMLSNYLMLVNEAGKLLFCEAIEVNLKGVGKDTFFVFHNKIVFIRNKSELFIYTF